MYVMNFAIWGFGGLGYSKYLNNVFRKVKIYV